MEILEHLKQRRTVRKFKPDPVPQAVLDTAFEAITESVRTRVRPIYMSSITTVFGMLPLVLFPGAGSEFYRGLGGVVVGGLLISTIFTIFTLLVLATRGFWRR